MSDINPYNPNCGGKGESSIAANTPPQVPVSKEIPVPSPQGNSHSAPTSAGKYAGFRYSS